MPYSHFHLFNAENLKALHDESKRTRRMLQKSPNPQPVDHWLNRLAPTSMSFDYETPLGGLFDDAEIDLLGGEQHYPVLRHFADFKRCLNEGRFSHNTTWFNPKAHFDLVDIAQAHRDFIERYPDSEFRLHDLFDEFCETDWRPIPETRNELIRFVCDLLMRFHTLSGETLFNTSEELIDQVAGCSNQDDGYTMRIVQLLLSTVDDKEKMPDWIAEFAESAPGLGDAPFTIHRPLSDK